MEGEAQMRVLVHRVENGCAMVWILRVFLAVNAIYAVCLLALLARAIWVVVVG